MRRKNLLKELGIQKQADISCNALDIDTENVRQRVYAKLDFADTERKQTTMRSKKKILPLLIAATLTIGVTAVAATGKISMWIGSSASRADYTSLPTLEQVTKDIGYRPILIDTFENGYCFKKGNIIKNSFKDDNANVIEKFKSVSFDYQKNGDVVSFEQQKFNSKLTPAGDIIATINGTNLYYVHYINKVVSDDYELTEQDKKDQASGKVVFSYDDSASQIEVSQVQSVNWNKDGIQYDLLQIDGKLSAGELADMAREVINNRKNSCPIYYRAAVLALRDILEVVETCEEVASAKWRGSDLYRYKIPPKKPRISPVYPPLQRTTVIFVTKDIPPIVQIKNPARRPIVVQPISETARKAAEACEFFTCLLIEFHNV